MTRRSLAAAALAAVATLLPACRGGGERSRPAGSAVWLDGAAPPLAVTDLGRFEDAGLRELFVDAAQLRWQGGQPQVQPLPPARASRRMRAMLVLRGDWPAAELADASGAARALATALDAVARKGEESGLAVAGWHLDLRGEPGDAQVQLLAELRDALEPAMLLSIDLPRAALTSEAHAEALADVADITDFVVSFLYGVREGERDDPAAWDFQRVRAAAQRLDGLREPYLVGVTVRGGARLVRSGAEVGEVPAITLADLAWNRALRVRHGFSLEGVDRQVYAFTAHYPTRVGGVALVPGDDVRVVGTSTAHVQELRRQMETWKLEHALGQLYYRLPHADDGLTLGVASLLRAVTGERSLPQPRVHVEQLGKSAGRVVLGVSLDNDSPEGSDLGGVESNFVELRAVGAEFVDAREGSFYRYDLLAPGIDGRLRRSGSPIVLRLFTPVLEPGAHHESGPIVLRTVRGGLGDVAVRASFLAPYGGTAELGPVSWKTLPPAPTPTPIAARTGAPPTRP